jgi:hypothetical protein
VTIGPVCWCHYLLSVLLAKSVSKVNPVRVGAGEGAYSAVGMASLGLDYLVGLKDRTENKGLYDGESIRRGRILVAE